MLEGITKVDKNIKENDSMASKCWTSGESSSNELLKKFRNYDI